MDIILFKFPGAPAINCVFTGRSPNGAAPGTPDGNISFKSGEPHDVMETRTELLAYCQKLGMNDICECAQVHGTDVLWQPEPTGIFGRPDSLPVADGMATDAAGVGLMIKTADCQPILLADKNSRAIMAIHSGWRGNRADFPQKAVANFCRKYNLRPADIYAVRGPSLGPAKSQFINYATEWGHAFDAWYDPETKCVNLWALSRFQLQAAGIDERHIYELDICTALNSDKYFSYRAKKDAGRQASLIWLA